MPPEILTALRMLAAQLDGAGVRWLVAGSTARALLGCNARPTDLDIEIGVDDVATTEVALELRLLPETGGGWSSLRGATQIEGVTVDVSAGVSAGGLGVDDEALFAGASIVRFDGRGLRVLGVGEQLRRARAAGDSARMAKILGRIPLIGENGVPKQPWKPS